MAITDKGDNTGNVFIDVLAAYSFLDIGGDRNITYSFTTSGNVSPHLWSSTDKQSWQSAMQQWLDVANITAQEISSPEADLREAWVSSDVMTAGHGLGPDGLPLVSYHHLPQIGGGSNFNGEFNRGYTGTVNHPAHWGPTGPATGTSGYWIFLYTIGQGLGLTPPSGTDQLANEPLFPGVTNAGDFGEFGYNQMVYTALSPNLGQYIPGAIHFGRPVTPMAFDIAAIQFLYGPNTNHRAGSDTYVLPDVNDTGTGWRCIWDAGGTDTIRYDGNLSATIDLRAATLVYGDPIAGGAVSRVGNTYGGFTIANGVVIENAVGGSGNDTLIGNSANNVLDGGAGNDTAIFSGPQSAYTVTDLGGSIRVVGPHGTDTLISVEHLQFLGIAGDPNGDPNAPGDYGFDAQYYLQHNPDVAAAGVDPLAHFNTHGWREGRNPNALFDTERYLTTYGDVAAANVNPFDHFNTFGWREGRDPDAFFSTNFYLGTNPDARSANLNPLGHYHTTGWKAGYDPGPNFDTTLYLQNNPDVAAAGMDPLEHFLRYGMAEGRVASAAIGNIVGGFDVQFYLQHNPDVAAAHVDPREHFNTYGWHEGRNPNALFDTHGYLAIYADVASANVNPLDHYHQHGWTEGRDPSTGFDTSAYLAAYADVAAAHIDPLVHFLQHGTHEGRSPFADGTWG
jgi:serralysin